MTNVTTEIEIKLTPSMMAKAFWNLGSVEQAEFFSELSRVIREDYTVNNSAYGNGELQWHFTCDEMQSKSMKDAKDTLMSMAAPLYLHTLNYIDSK